MKLIPFIFVFLLASCLERGSEIGNPASPPDTVINGDSGFYISRQEAEVLRKLGDSFDVFKLHTYRNQLTAEEADVVDSMLVKAFNNVYYNGGK